MDFISFGEILFDVFPDKATLGGAPLNVAGHLTKLGLNGYILSAVGDDELGKRAISEINNLGLNTEKISTLNYETGKAIITLNGKNAEYEFNMPCAWDNIPLLPLPEHVSLIYYEDDFTQIKIVVQRPSIQRRKKETQFALHICNKKTHGNGGHGCVWQSAHDPVQSVPPLDNTKFPLNCHSFTTVLIDLLALRCFLGD